MAETNYESFSGSGPERVKEIKFVEYGEERGVVTYKIMADGLEVGYAVFRETPPLKLKFLHTLPKGEIRLPDSRVLKAFCSQFPNITLENVE
jgi:hypothetical protein